MIACMTFKNLINKSFAIILYNPFTSLIGLQFDLPFNLGIKVMYAIIDLAGMFPGLKRSAIIS
jgi:hypothetical protein